jgi:hypothetical protein
MLSKLTLTTALTLSAAGYVAHTPTAAADCVAHVPSLPTGAGRARSSTYAETDAAEMGDPNSVDYRNRPISSHSPSNDEINAAERGSPDSPDYREGQPALLADRNVNAEWQAAETGDPDSVDYLNRTIFSHSPTDDEIRTADRGTPESPGYKSGQPALSMGRNVDTQGQALDCPDPHAG